MSCCKIPAFIGNRLYRMELAAIYSIGGISGYCACCYTGNLTILVEGNLAVDYGIAILHVDRCTLAVNHTCSSCCTIQCHFSIAIADTFDANQILVQLNFNLSLVIAYADVLVAAEVNIIAGFYVCCFGCNTVSRQIPTCISSVAYFFQLAYVYSVGISSTCCYIGNLTSNFFTLYRTAYRNSTISCLPSNTGFSFSSTIAKRACSCACYAANAQSNAAFCTYASTAADSNCIIGCNFILMTEGNNIAYAVDYVFVAHYNRIGNISQFIVRTCHEYVMATLFIITGKFVIIADNGRIGLFGNSVGTADYCNSTAFFLSQCAIVTLANIACFKSIYIHILIGISNLVAGTLNRYTIRSLDSVCGAHNIISYAGINLTVFIIYSILRADNGCRCTLNI